MGASYDAGGFCGLGACVTTDRRAESPTINCTGHTGITLGFYYIENGDGTFDDGSVYYYDGTAWSLLVNTPKTTTCITGQGKWAHYTIALPASANGNPNVKIGFRWVNNDDGTGTDPSFAVDSVSLSTVGSVVTAPVASYSASDTLTCQDSCITFTSTSTGTVDSVLWSIPGVTIANPRITPVTVCFPGAGTYPVTLTAWHGTSSNATTHNVVVNPAPHPVVTAAGHSLSVAGTYTSYQWVKNGVNITGATSGTYTYTVGGNYQVIVDSGGCPGMSALVHYNVGVAQVSAGGNDFSISQTDNGSFTLYATGALDENLEVALYDATGRKVLQQPWTVGSDRLNVWAGDLSSGLYVVRLSGTNTSAVLKWMKQ